MKSRWFESKQKAIEFRKHGISIRIIERRLGISRSTLSGWFRSVPLTEKQEHRLRSAKLRALEKNRAKAVEWHRARKKENIRQANEAALGVLGRIDTKDSDILDIILSALYLGEGFKKTVGTGLGNSDPLILQAFIAILRRNYGIEISRIRCQLHLRADQDPEELKRFWANALQLPLENFSSVMIDERTRGFRTYPGYNGVCAIRCGNSFIQRKLLALSRQCLEKIVKESTGT